MSKHFRIWKTDEAPLLPASVQDYVRKDHPSRFIVALVREHLDLSEIEASYASTLGRPAFPSHEFRSSWRGKGLCRQAQGHSVR